jgi:hypothetical protein
MISHGFSVWVEVVSAPTAFLALCPRGFYPVVHRCVPHWPRARRRRRRGPANVPRPMLAGVPIDACSELASRALRVSLELAVAGVLTHFLRSRCRSPGRRPVLHHTQTIRDGALCNTARAQTAVSRWVLRSASCQPFRFWPPKIKSATGDERHEMPANAQTGPRPNIRVTRGQIDPRRPRPSSQLAAHIAGVTTT